MRTLTDIPFATQSLDSSNRQSLLVDPTVKSNSQSLLNGCNGIKKFSMLRKITGFTLIELIIVIIIIGILAAIAIPRFINQTGSARAASLNGLAGALNSASSLIASQYKGSGATGSTITTDDGQSVAVTASAGIPLATTAGIGNAIKSTTGYTATATTGVLTYTLTGVTNSSCNVVYTNTAGASGTPTASDGTAVATTSGC